MAVDGRVAAVAAEGAGNVRYRPARRKPTFGTGAFFTLRDPSPRQMIMMRKVYPRSAINLLLASSFYLPVSDLARRRRGILHAIAGPAAIFSILLLMEFARRRHGVPTRPGHPFTSLRIAQLYRIVDLYRQNEHAWLAQRATELAHVCCEIFYPEEVEAFRTQEVSDVQFTIMDNILRNCARQHLVAPNYDEQGGVV